MPGTQSLSELPITPLARSRKPLVSSSAAVRCQSPSVAEFKPQVIAEARVNLMAPQIGVN
jgi:hypothetical protein